MGTSYNANIVTDGLVLCLDAANPRSYPGSGTSWYDLSGNGNHATLNNTDSSTWEDTYGGAFYLGLTNEYASILNSASLNTDYITVEYVLSHTHKVHAYPIINKSSENVDGRFWRFGVSNANNFSYYWWAEIGEEVYYDIGANTGFTNDIYHLVGTYDGQALSMFVNGVKQSDTESVVGTLYNNGGDIEIARNKFYSPDRYASHKSYMARIYNRALSQNEINVNFQAIRCRYGI
jgi:hypothetical protein